MEKIRVLFVCLGNICRSPLAEAIFKHKIKERKVEHMFEVHSCGTANYHIGDSPDSRTIANAKRNGVEIDHAGRQLCVADFDSYDYIFVMDQSNRKNALRLTANATHRTKVIMMREFDTIGKGEDVPDPYYGTEKDFQEVFDILNRSTENLLLDFLKREKQNGFSF
jgi:protein-tyrosine phosphatase